MKKIACCMFGQQRAFPLFLPNYLEMWESDEWETDWFCHTSRTNETHGYRHDILKEKYNYDMPKELGEKEEFVLRDILKCKKYEIEEEYFRFKGILEKYLPSISDKIQEEYGFKRNDSQKYLFSHAIYSAQRVIQLVREYENEMDMRYDAVFVFRPDVKWLMYDYSGVLGEFANLQFELDKHESVEPNWIDRAVACVASGSHVGWPMMSDWYFYGTSNSIQNFAENWLENQLSLLTWYTKIEEFGMPSWGCVDHPLLPILDRFLQCLGRRHPFSRNNANHTLWYTFGDKNFSMQLMLNVMSTMMYKTHYQTNLWSPDADLSYVADEYPIWEK
jgi:hypothetical protein